MSIKMRLVGEILRRTRRRVFLTEAGAQAFIAAPKAAATPTRAQLNGLRLSSRPVQGFEVAVLSSSETATEGAVVVYLHGGAFVNPVSSQHWDLARALARRTGAEVWVPQYGLLPEHDAHEARGLLRSIVAETAGELRPTYLVGDSSGGNLALLAGQLATGSARGSLRGITLIAPWVDLTLAHPEVVEAARHDPWLALPGLVEIARRWTGTQGLSEGELSPLSSALDALPPVEIWIGTRDLMHPDCLRLAHAIREAGGHVEVHELDGGLHVFPLLPVPEGKAARLRIIETVYIALRPRAA